MFDWWICSVKKYHLNFGNILESSGPAPSILGAASQNKNFTPIHEKSSALRKLLAQTLNRRSYHHGDAGQREASRGAPEHGDDDEQEESRREVRERVARPVRPVPDRDAAHVHQLVVDAERAAAARRRHPAAEPETVQHQTIRDALTVGEALSRVTRLCISCWLHLP